MHENMGIDSSDEDSNEEDRSDFLDGLERRRNDAKVWWHRTTGIECIEDPHEGDRSDFLMYLQDKRKETKKWWRIKTGRGA